MAGISKDDVKSLQEQIDKLQAELSSERVKRTDAEEIAASLSHGAQFTGNTTEEQPTGKTESIEKCVNPWERNEKKQRFITVDLPTFFYTINLPTGAGLYLSTNGTEYYHGQTYEFNSEILAEMKDRVAKCWKHEESISGSNENAYRKTTNKKFG